MSNLLIVFLLSAGTAGWVYNYSMRHTGSNTRSSLIAAAAVAAIVFVIALSLVSLIPE